LNGSTGGGGKSMTLEAAEVAEEEVMDFMATVTEELEVATPQEEPIAEPEPEPVLVAEETPQLDESEPEKKVSAVRRIFGRMFGQ